MMALYKASNGTKYRDYSLSWANRHNFALKSSQSNPYFAEHQAAGQPYLDLYEDNLEPRRRAAILKEIDATIATGRTDHWWVDARHMALPIFARLNRMDYGDRLYRYTRVQRADGFWNVNLGGPNNCPGPETSGTAFFACV